MCSVCLQVPCSNRCPNAEEKIRELIIQCDHCGEKLYEDDEYLDAEDAMVCRKCVERMTVAELMEICNLRYERAG